MRQIFQGYYGLYFLLLYCLALQNAIAKFIINLYSMYYKTIKFKNHCISIANSLQNPLLFHCFSLEMKGKRLLRSSQ